MRKQIYIAEKFDLEMVVWETNNIQLKELIDAVAEKLNTNKVKVKTSYIDMK